MIVVTGGAGFIGSNLVWQLNHQGEHDLVVVDRLDSPTKHMNLNRLQFVDLIDPDDHAAVDRCCIAASGIAASGIVHLGACTDTTETDGRLMMDTNYVYARRLVHLALEHQIPLVYASSAAVYGDGEQGFVERRRCEFPLNLYAFSKLMLDNHVRHLLAGGAHSPVVGLRYFNVYGPQEQHKGRMASVVLHFHRQLQQHGEIRLFEGSRDFLRDFVHVDDVVRVTLWALRKQVSGVFNCGTGQAHSFHDIACIMQRRVRGTPPIRFVEFPDELRGKYQRYTQADLGALRQAGYDGDFTPLEQGVARYHAMLTQADGYLPPP